MNLSEEMRPFLARVTNDFNAESPTELVFRILSIATGPEAEEDGEDPRFLEIAALVRSATPEARTRMAQIATTLEPVLKRIRTLVLTVKSEALDADVAHGDAEILPDGWLVVKMGDEVVGRVPFNPERGEQEAATLAESILSEHVKLHVLKSLEVVRIPIPEDAGAKPVRPDGVRRRGMVVQ